MSNEVSRAAGNALSRIQAPTPSTEEMPIAKLNLFQRTFRRIWYGGIPSLDQMNALNIEKWDKFIVPEIRPDYAYGITRIDSHITRSDVKTIYSGVRTYREINETSSHDPIRTARAWLRMKPGSDRVEVYDREIVIDFLPPKLQQAMEGRSPIITCNKKDIGNRMTREEYNLIFKGGNFYRDDKSYPRVITVIDRDGDRVLEANEMREKANSFCSIFCLGYDGPGKGRILWYLRETNGKKTRGTFRIGRMRRLADIFPNG